METVLALEPEDLGCQHASSASHSLCGWGHLGALLEQSHCRCNKLNVAAHTTPRLRTILMLGSQPRGDSTGSWEGKGWPKGD